MKVKVMRLKSDYLLKSSLLYFDIFTHWQGKKYDFSTWLYVEKPSEWVKKSWTEIVAPSILPKKQKKISALAKMVQKNKGT